MRPVELLRDLLRLRTINPPGDEGGAATILEAYLSDAGLETEIKVSPGGRSNLIARLEGPLDTPALVLLSHSDVVSVEEDAWSRDPFGGELHEGFIWGRGALDMKSITVMHAVAAAELARSGRSRAREVIVAMVADEEAGGDDGARWLLDEHASSVGFAEGRPPPEVIGEGAYGITGMLERPVIPIALGEKTAVWFDVIVEGDPGHGGLPPLKQAPTNLASIVKEVSGFGRARVHPVMREQFATLAAAASGANATVFRGLASRANLPVSRAVAPQLRKAGAVGFLLSDSVTPTVLKAGYKSNVVPGQAHASFDCRLLPDTDIDEFLSSVDKRARREGGRVANVAQKGHGPVSPKGPLFDILERASRDLIPNAVTTATLTPVITDVRHFRARGATGYGWTPLVLTPELVATIHGHDERIGSEDFEKAIGVMSDVLFRAVS